MVVSLERHSSALVERDRRAVDAQASAGRRWMAHLFGDLDRQPCIACERAYPGVCPVADALEAAHDALTPAAIAACDRRV